jgi:SH3-like domain-containing protein
MRETIQRTLAEIAAAFGDRNLQVCTLEAKQPAPDRCDLSGAVLDDDTLAAAMRALATRVPEVVFDATAVRILRTATPTVLTVQTNLTSLHLAPSFLAEMSSQLLNRTAVEVLMEEDAWAFTRQEDGYLGWTYRPYLTADIPGAATHLVSAAFSLMHESASHDAPLAGRVLGGTAVSIAALDRGWARLVLAGGQGGWIPAGDLRSLDALPSTSSSRREQIMQDAFRFVGVPYLWGGASAFGIDCSAFVRLLHRLAGVTLPRDSYMQFEAGQAIEPPGEPGDLLFFGNGSRVTHVALSLGGWRIIHSSRANNGVYEDAMPAVPRLVDSFMGARTFLQS